jgi:hypothetical protein
MNTLAETSDSDQISCFSKSNDFKNKLVLDSGATEHYTPNKDWLLDYKEINNKFITVANGDKMVIKGIGNIPVFINNKEVLIKNVNYIPNIKTTLISSNELAKKGWQILFKDTKAIISHKEAKLSLIANWISNAYYIDININYNILEPIVYKIDPIIESNNNELDLYHKRLLHINKDYIIKTINSVNGLKNINKNTILHNCDSCYFGKFSRIISKEPLLNNNQILTIIDMDIAGPFKIKGLKGESYFLTITCRTSRAIWIYPIKYKSDALDVLTRFYTLIEVQFKTKIQIIRLDNAAEFKSSKWTLFCNNKGIVCEYTSPYTPNQNGIAERLNRYIIERLISICSEKNIPLRLWPYIVQAIAHIKNRTYNSIINKTPYEALTKNKPNIAYIKILGSLVYVLDPKEIRSKTDLGKLAKKANKGILIGYKSSKNFIIYIPSTNQIVDSSHIDIKEDLVYNENYLDKEDYSELLEQESLEYDYIKPYFSPNNNEQSPNLETRPNPGSETILGPSSETSSRTKLVVEVPNYIPSEQEQSYTEDNRRSSRLQNKEPTYKGLSIYNLASIAYLGTLNKGDDNLLSIDKDDNLLSIDKPNLPKLEFSNSLFNLETMSSNTDNLSIVFKEPKSYKEAINSIYKDKWLDSMKIEYNSLNNNKTWDLVPLPKGAKALKTRWVYKVKNPNNSQNVNDVTFKSRFVAKGFEQLYGLNYIETYAAVIKQLAWKLIFALAILNNWLIYKIDMISAFTQGLIDCYLYITQPKGFEDPNNPEFVLRLNKALYGLKQSARIWYQTLREILVNKLDFIVLQSEDCVYINKKLNIIICLYVDDLAVIAFDINTINTFISQIKKYFDIKNLGLIKDYLGISIDLNLKDGYIKLSQTKYIEKILVKYNMETSNPIYTPMDSKAKIELNKEQASKETIKLFQGIIGSLLYIALGTRPDIAFSVIKLARFASNPSLGHIALAKRILHYIKATKDYGITYYNNKYNTNTSNYIYGYCDSDYAGDINTAKSTLGYIFFIAGGPISWKSKLQTIIAQSTTEAEFIAINSASKEAVFIKQLMTELGAYKQTKFLIYTDNNSALALAKNPVFHKRTKHIAVKYYYVRQLIE